MARGMARSMPNTELKARQVQRLKVGKVVAVDWRSPVPLRNDSEERSQLTPGIQSQVVVVGVNVDGGARLLLERTGAAYVIDVTVSQKKCNRRQVVFSQQTDNIALSRRCINNDRRPTPALGHDIAVGLGEPQ